MAYSVICDRCGSRYKNNELYREPQTGYMVCRLCLDPRRQINMAPRPARPQIPWSSPQIDINLPATTQILLPQGEVTITGSPITVTEKPALGSGSFTITGSDLTELNVGDGRIVAVSDGGGVWLSDDNGETWTASTVPTARTWNWSVWSGQHYCVTNAGDKLIYSASAESDTWTEITLPDPSAFVTPAWRRLWLASDASHIIAVHGENGGGESYIATSTDHGVNWTLSTRIDASGGAVAAVGCDYNPTTDTYVVVGNPGSANSHCRYSHDGGSTWSVATGLTTFRNWRVIRYVPWLDRWVAINNSNSTDGVGYSDDDGETWTCSSGVLANDLMVLGDKLVAVGESANAYVSTDGITWDDYVITDIAQGWRGVSYNGTGWFAYTFANNATSAFTTNPEASPWTDYGANQPNSNFNHSTSRFIHYDL